MDEDEKKKAPWWTPMDINILFRNKTPFMKCDNLALAKHFHTLGVYFGFGLTSLYVANKNHGLFVNNFANTAKEGQQNYDGVALARVEEKLHKVLDIGDDFVRRALIDPSAPSKSQSLVKEFKAVHKGNVLGKLMEETVTETRANVFVNINARTHRVHTEKDCAYTLIVYPQEQKGYQFRVQLETDKAVVFQNCHNYFCCYYHGLQCL